jgi:hypothetical protein
VASQLESVVCNIHAERLYLNVVACCVQLVLEEEGDAAGAGAEVEQAQFGRQFVCTA